MTTQMLAHGVAVVTVSQRLGRARASTTLNVYGHCIPGADHFISNLMLHREPAQGRTSRGRCEFAVIGAHAIDFNRRLPTLTRAAGSRRSSSGPVEARR
jgi:hypothetical protein